MFLSAYTQAIVSLSCADTTLVGAVFQNGTATDGTQYPRRQLILRLWAAQTNVLCSPAHSAHP